MMTTTTFPGRSVSLMCFSFAPRLVMVCPMASWSGVDPRGTNVSSVSIGAFFAGALLIETIFSLDGLGLLSFESVLNRDYPVVFANLYIFALVGLVVGLISDLTYTVIDPRIDFETREV